ncbi:unnamed protein product [Camellia sinensis]
MVIFIFLCSTHVCVVIEDAQEIEAEQGPKQFSFKTLSSATEGFHAKNKLGKGGFAQVYKGKLNDGREIAVKKPLMISDKGKELVLKEMKLLLRNDSETGRSDALEWKRTYDIIVGVAQGLLYLHERSHSVIIHCDIKPTNILIDENLVPKIADFGTASLFPQDQTHVNISEATGTRGGANELSKEGRVLEFMDQKLVPLVVLDQVQLCIHIGIMCTEYDPKLQPTMGHVYSMLSENHSSSSTLVEESMRDGSSSASSIARNSSPTELANYGSSSGADIHLQNEGLPKHRRLTHA